MNVTLDWSLAIDTVAITDDLDMGLYRGTGVNKALNPTVASTNMTLFEKFNMADSLPDGDYTLVVDYFDIPYNGTFRLRFKGNTVAREYQYNGIAFTTAQDHTVQDFVRVTKKGHRYSFSRF